MNQPRKCNVLKKYENCVEYSGIFHGFFTYGSYDTKVDVFAIIEKENGTCKKEYDISRFIDPGPETDNGNCTNYPKPNGDIIPNRHNHSSRSNG